MTIYLPLVLVFFTFHGDVVTSILHSENTVLQESPWLDSPSLEADGTDEYGFLFSDSTSLSDVSREEEPVLFRRSNPLFHSAATKLPEEPKTLAER